MSNKFWAAGSDSDSESSEASSSGSDDDRQVGGRATGRFQMSDSSSDSEDDRRVVRSAKDRVMDALRESVEKVNNGLKVHDWSIIEDEFQKTNKRLEKSKNQLAEGTPKFYVKMLAAVEDAVTEVTKDKAKLKAMKPAVTRIISRMKQTVKKHNKNFESDILDYREQPDAYDTAESESDSDDSDSDSNSDEDSDEDEDESEDDLMKKPKAKAFDDDDSLSDDSMFKDNDLSDDSDSDDDDLFAPLPAAAAPSGDGRPALAGRARWLKKPDAEKKKKDKTVKAAPAKSKAGAKAVVMATRRVQVVERTLTEEEVSSRLEEIVASRGRKGTDPRELLRKLEMLSRQARKYGPRVEIPVVMHLVSVMYDSHRVIDDYMNLPTWRTAFRYIMRVVTLLESDLSLKLGMVPSDDATVSSGGTTSLMKKATGGGDQPEDEAAAEEKGEAESPASNSSPDTIRVVGTLETFLVRLEGEYTKSLQQINPHTQDYLVRLADEASLIELSEMIFAYYKRIGDHDAASSVALVNVEHIYYKHDTMSTAVQKAHAFNKKWGRLADIHPSCTSKMVKVPESERSANNTHPAAFFGYPQVEFTAVNSADKLHELCQFIYKHGDERTKSRALLCCVFHHALHDRFYKARDLFLISHIQDVVDKVDTKTQILFNRVLAALGLSAFRAGLIQKAHDCLSGICSGKPMQIATLQIKELLAQGQARWPDKDPEQERIERRRQMPYHMHVNPDLLDCCYLTCAMLLEMPQIAKGSVPGAGVISKPFRKLFLTYNRQVFTGPPENTRERVMAASKALLEGDWKKGCNYILGMDVWNLIPNEGGEKVKAMLFQRIKDEAVRVHLLKDGAGAYSSIGLDHLCEAFDMDAISTRRIVSKMIFNRELSAAWDGDTLVLQKSESSPLQQLSVRVGEKVGMLVESNERLLDPLNGGHMFGGRDEWQDTRGGRRNWQDDGQRRGGSRFAKSGASGRGDYQRHHGGGDRRHHHGGRGGHHQNRGNRHGGYHGGHGHGGGGHGRRDHDDKPKPAWSAVA